MIGQAVVLAGGEGRRLAAAGHSLPKPLVRVGGVPAIDRVLAGLAAAGVARFVVVVGRGGDEVIRHLETARLWPVTFARQAEPRGTADALVAARDQLDERFLFTWCDVMVEAETYAAVGAVAAGDGALAVNRGEHTAGAAVSVTDGLVTGIVEKPPPGTIATPWNNAGIGLAGPGLWPHVERLAPSPRREFELPEAIGNWIAAGARIVAVEVSGGWHDIGTPEGLEAADRQLG